MSCSLLSEARVLVVTPTLGQSAHLAEALESVHRAGIAVQHVIVVPKKNAANVIRVCPRCTVVTEEAGRGIYHAIELGLRAAAPWEWFTYLNDDDLLTSGFGEVAEQHVATADASTIAFGEVRMIDEDGRNLGLMPVERRTDRFAWLMKQGVPPMTQQGTIISHAVYSRLNGFDTRYQLVADFDFWTRAVVASVRFQYFPREVGRWRIHSGQASMNRMLASAEMRAIGDSIAMPTSVARLRWERLRYCAANLPRYVERYRMTGVVRSGALFARMASRSTAPSGSTR